MPLLDLLRRRTATTPVRWANRWSAADWGFTRTLNSVVANATAYRCIETIVSTMSRPSWEVLTPGTDEPIDNHPLLDLLNQPDTNTSGTMFQRHIARDLELAGKTLWIKNQQRDRFGDRGEVFGLQRVPIDRVTVIGNDEDELVGFVYRNRVGQTFALLPDDVVYLRYPHPERAFDGLAPAIMAGLGAETDNAAARFNYDLLANDGAVPGYITIENLSPDQFTEWKALWDAGEYPGKTRFVSGNAKYHKVGQTNQELTYDALRGASQADIYRAFGVPEVMVEPQDATFANMSEARRFFFQTSIWPKLVLIADELTMQLGRAYGVEIGFDLSTVEELGDALKDLVNRNVMLLDRNAVTINEVRGDLGLDPVPWGDVPNLSTPPPMPTLDSGGTKDVKGIQAPTIGAPADWAKFDRRVTTYEARAMRAVQQFFIRQGAVITARLRSQSGKSVTKATAPGQWWDRDRWNRELAAVAADVLTDTFDAFGSLVLLELVPGTTFDTQAERVARYITNRATDIASLVNGTTEEELRTVLAEAAENGASVDVMAGLIDGYFADQGPMRAERVARTEVIGAANAATVEAGRQSGVVTGKRWLATNDPRTDDDCAALNGTIVGLDDGFGDVDYPPAHPNCRCTVLLELGETTNE